MVCPDILAGVSLGAELRRFLDRVGQSGRGTNRAQCVTHTQCRTACHSHVEVDGMHQAHCHAQEVSMLLQQYYLGCLAHASYLIADEATGTAVVVDPQRDIDQYLADAGAHGLHIRYVFLTHFHADFLAGHLELYEQTGATICLGAQAQADYAFTPFHNGETLTFGHVRLTVLETPGPTPEAIPISVSHLAHKAIDRT